MNNYCDSGNPARKDQTRHPQYSGRLLLAVGFASAVLTSAALTRDVSNTSVLDRMSLSEKIGQMLQVQFYMNSTHGGEGDTSHLLDEIKHYHLGSLDFRVPVNGPNLVRAQSEAAAKALNSLQAAAPIPLLIGADIERGMISRFGDVPDMPNVMAWDAGGDPKTVRTIGEMTADEARAVGIQWAFAPVVDVNSDPDNPIIGDRSFGDDPEEVGRLSAEYIRGARAHELLTTAKHFPGHGDTATDSHVGMVTLNESVAQLKQVEFIPFEQAISAGVDAVMLAHARVPALDPDPHKIATTSAKIIQGTLRRDLGFKGVIITDSMAMHGLTELYKNDPHPIGRAAVDAVKAGADILMLPTGVDTAYDAILNAVKSGEIPESRIDESVRRILAMKERAGLFRNRFVDVSKVHEIFSRKADWDLAQQVADNAVTLVRNKSFALPIESPAMLKGSAVDTKRSRMALVLLTDSRRSPLGNVLEEEFRKRNPEVQTRHIYYDNHSSWETSDVLDTVRGADLVMIAAFLTNLPGRKDVATGGKVVDVIGLNGQSAELFKQIVSIAGPKAIVVSLGSPYLILRYPNIQNYICTFSISSTSERAAVKALFGEIQNKARLPVSLPGVAERGFAIPWPQKNPGKN